MADYRYRLIDIEQDFLKAVQKMQLLAFFCYIVAKAVFYAAHSEKHPLLYYLFYAEHHRAVVYQYIKVAAERILKRGKLKKL